MSVHPSKIIQLNRKKEIKLLITGEFPVGPVVKDPPSNAEDTGSVSGQGNKSPQEKQPKVKKKKNTKKQNSHHSG